VIGTMDTYGKRCPMPTSFGVFTKRRLQLWIFDLKGMGDSPRRRRGPRVFAQSWDKFGMRLPAFSPIDGWYTGCCKAGACMAGTFDKLKVSAAKLETPTAIRHVESHLIFGPLSLHFPLAHVAVVLIVASLTVTVVTTKVWNGQK
jgi:hypothetical protein